MSISDVAAASCAAVAACVAAVGASVWLTVDSVVSPICADWVVDIVVPAISADGMPRAAAVFHRVDVAVASVVAGCCGSFFAVVKLPAVIIRSFCVVSGLSGKVDLVAVVGLCPSVVSGSSPRISSAAKGGCDS